MTISYAITVCNERQEIEKLLSQIFMFIRPEDEVVVLYDEKNGDSKVWEYLNLVALTGDNLLKGFNIHESEFNGHFADWKNKLNSLCTGDYIFNIDADEIPNKFLLENLPYVLENSEVDLLYVSRINTVKDITQQHIQKWGWNISKFESMVEEKELDLDNPQDLDEYNLLKEYDLIIEETIMEK